MQDHARKQALGEMALSLGDVPSWAMRAFRLNSCTSTEARMVSTCKEKCTFRTAQRLPAQAACTLMSCQHAGGLMPQLMHSLSVRRRLTREGQL